MKAKIFDLLLALFVFTILVGACFLANAEGQNPDWYEACKPDHGNYQAWLKCTTDQMPGPKVLFPQCEGNIDARCIYEAVRAMSAAPDGWPWQLHFYSRDQRARELESCNICLRTARNRSKCKC